MAFLRGKRLHGESQAASALGSVTLEGSPSRLGVRLGGWQLSNSQQCRAWFYFPEYRVCLKIGYSQNFMVYCHVPSQNGKFMGIL